MILVNKGFSQERLLGGHTEFDAILGIHFLKTKIWTLKNLLNLPDTLEKMGFILAPEALIFALGDKDKLTKEFVNDMTDEELTDFFKKWRDQPASEDLARELVLYEQRTVILNSKVLGCYVLINCDNSPSCVTLAEGILSAIESLLATGVNERIVAHEPLVEIKIRKSDFTEIPFTFEVQENDGKPNYDIKCAEFDTHMIPNEIQQCIQDKIFELIVHFLARVFTIDNIEQTLSKLFREECGLERAINFTSSFVTLSNVLGNKPKTSISDWFDSDSQSYSLRRSEEWDAADRRGDAGNKSLKNKPIMGKGTPPINLHEISQVKHNEIETVSLIRKSLWDKAGWTGVGFMGDLKCEYPPILILIFRDIKIASSIFTEWKRELGAVDKDDKIRIAFVKGISQKNPHFYRVIIGSDPQKTFLDAKTKRIAFISRIHTMEASTNQNLDYFLKSFNKHSEYALTYAIMPEEMSQIEPVLTSTIVKHNLSVRDAWEIGPNDLDAVCIQSDDDVIIPKDKKDAPVLELLRKIKDEQR